MSFKSLRRSSRAIGVAVLAATLGIAGLGLATAPMAGADIVDEAEDACARLAGTTRFGTAGAIADAYATEVAGTDTAIVANGRNFPDALAASGLARELGAPVVLVEPPPPGEDRVPLETQTALDDLGVTNVVIVGGVLAVSQAVEDELADRYGATRRVQGDDRYETAADIATEAAPAGQLDGLTTALIATGENYPDALAGGPVAYHGDGTNQFPILLVRGNSVPAETTAALNALGIEQVVILGGTNAVSAAVEAELESQTGNDARRLAGPLREDTAVEVADFAVDELGFDTDAALLADGRAHFPSPDALTGGPLGGEVEAPILLVTPDNMPAQTEAFLTARAELIRQVIALGGTAAVATEVLEAGCTAAGVPTEGPVTQATVVVDQDTVEPGGDITGVVTGENIESVTVTGCGLTDEPVTDEDATQEGIQFTLTIPADQPEGQCELVFTVTFTDGTTETHRETITVTAPATNQTFAVTPTEFLVNPTGTEHTVNLDTLAVDIDNVRIQLVDPDLVTIEDGIVTFTDADDDNFAEFGTTEAEIREAEGVLQPAGTEAVTVDTTDGEATIVIATDQGEIDDVLVVAFDPDTQNRLVLEADDTPAVDFGVSGTKLFADVETLVMDPETDANQFGTDHTVTATLATGTGDFDGGDIVVPLDGEEVDFLVAEVSEAEAGAEFGQPDCPARGDVTLAQTVTTATVTTDDGVATFTYTGPADPTTNAGDEIFHCIYADWEGTGEFQGQTADGLAIKTWTDAEAAPAALDAEPETAVNLVGTNHTVTATVVDQFGDPVAGETVRFEIDRQTGTDPTPVTRTTNSEGVATLTYTGPAEADVDTILVCAADAITAGTCEPESNALADEVEKEWVEDQPGAPSFAAASAVAGDEFVTVTYDELIDCATVDLNASNYEVTTTTTGGVVTEREEVTAVCVTPAGGADEEVVITIAGDPLVSGETVRVTAVVGDDGNTVLDLAGTAQPVGDDVATTVTP